MKQKFSTKPDPHRGQLPSGHTFANAGLPLPPPVTPPLEYAGSKGLKNGEALGRNTPVPPMGGGRRPRRGQAT